MTTHDWARLLFFSGILLPAWVVLWEITIYLIRKRSDIRWVMLYLMTIGTVIIALKIYPYLT